MEYGRVTQLSSMRALMVKTMWRGIRVRLAWRETPARAPNDKTPESRGTYTIQRIKQNAQDGYGPFWMQKGGVDPCVPKSRWDTLSCKQFKNTPETVWFMWTAGIIDDIENDGRMLDFKTESIKPNPYRDSIVNRVCMEAFKSKHASKFAVYERHGALVARMFAKGTQGAQRPPNL